LRHDRHYSSSRSLSNAEPFTRRGYNILRTAQRDNSRSRTRFGLGGCQTDNSRVFGRIIVASGPRGIQDRTDNSCSEKRDGKIRNQTPGGKSVGRRTPADCGFPFQFPRNYASNFHCRASQDFARRVTRFFLSSGFCWSMLEFSLTKGVSV